MATLRGHGATKGQNRGAIDGARIGWFAPTFTILEDIWRDLKTATKDAAVKVSETRHRVDLPGGGSVEVRSGDNADTASRGPGWDGVVLDEAAFMEKRLWTHSIRPALSDRQGWAIMITSPNGYNWLKEQYDAAYTRAGWARWQRPTRENPLVPASELEEARLDMGDVAFAQEHEAQFTDIESAEFPGSYFWDGMWFSEWPRDLVFKVMACDPSKGKTDKSDYSAYAMVGLDREGTLWVDCDMRRRDVYQIAADGVTLYRLFQPIHVAFEVNQFQEMLAGKFEEVALQAGLLVPVIPVENRENKKTRIRNTLTGFLARREVRFRTTPGGRMLVDQLRGFPDNGVHDDGPDAMEMAVRLLKRLYAGGGVLEGSPSGGQDDGVYFESAV